MMNEQRPSAVSSLLAELARAQVKLRPVEGGRLEVIAPRGRLSARLREGISRHKSELLERLTRAEDEGEVQVELPTITPDPQRLYEPFPPSDLQQSFIIGSREGFEYYVRPHQYNETELGDLDPARFEEALNRALLRQRKSLVVVRDDMLLQTVRDPEPVRVTVSDLRGMPEETAREEMERVRAKMRREEPPHDRWPWLHPHICLYGEGKARLHYNSNNLFMDAPSGTRLFTDAMHYYRHPDRPLPELELSFRDSVLALAELEESQLGQRSKKYWYDRLADWPEAPDIPLLEGDRHRGRSRLSRRELFLPAQQWMALKRACEAHGVTVTNTLLSAHAEVLSYWSGSRHFLLNNMITHRLPLHPESGEIMGQFASLYPLEVDWRPREHFADRARRLQAQVMADVSHLYWSGAKVLQELNQVRRTPGRASCPFAVGSALFVGPAERPTYSMLETPQTLLDTEFWELRDGRLWVIWDVIEAAFPEGLIDVMFEGYRRVIGELAESGSAWERTAFDLLPEDQRRQRSRLNHRVGAPPSGLLHRALRRQPAMAADRAAVVSGETSLSYAELLRRADALAGRLRELGTRPGDLVAVALPKGLWQIAAVFGVLRAGAAYVPVDPGWPEDRIRYVLGDTGAAAVVCSAETARMIATLADVSTLDVDGVAEAEWGEPDFAAPEVREPSDLAYVIYTSGSTGRPKGAMLDHRGPLNTVTDINRRFGVGPDDVVFGVSSLCFDLSVYDVFGTVEAGATLLLPEEGQTDPASWTALVRERGVTVWNSVPAVMELFVEAAEAAGTDFPALRTVLLSGDWIPVGLPDRIRRVAPHARVISLGGATEASIWSICYPIERTEPHWTSIPYGRPLTGQTWHVLDDEGRDAPTWVTGHLHIGGVGVGMAYLNDPVKTDAAFVSHPTTGERLYRTGDLGRYLPSGDIEFLGRSDFQVKIQGFRVEPGEIEHALLEDPRVLQAAVTVRASGAGRQLAAFVVVRACEDGGDPPEPEELRAGLAERLPGYMVPGHVAVLDRLPLTANGKVDRTALQALGPSGPGAERTYTAARTDVEAELVDIWESVLGIERIGVHDDFFDLGGQSFAALRVIGRIAERLGGRVPMSTFLERRTVASLAAHLARAREAWSPLVPLREAGGDPQSPWFLVHPAGGNVLCYRRLAEGLRRPGYGLQAPGPADGQQPLDTVEDLAELYVRALLEVQPHGPYRLGGWSSGSVIAFGLARLLEERGERVERVVVLDSPAPLAPRDVDDARLLLWFLEDLGVGFDAGRVDAATVDELAALPETERLTRATALAAGQGAGTGLRLEDLADTLAVFRGVVRACNTYQAPRISASVTVVRAERNVVTEFADQPHAQEPEWGWARLTAGEVTSLTVPGTHHTLLTEPNALALITAAFNEQ
ncbi:amino acid adenylation domain-containing protein [Streptomyces coeruleorubidus]|uniref:amino acid adenylation domain-containing protein n=1 Tax=Streptomyces coeruleorubidus TaxID=116188 RepID=UPI00378CABFD